MNIWSFGGGVQSCAIAALIVRGELEKPDIAVIADTHFEQSTTWEYLDNVVNPALSAIGLNVVRIPASEFSTVGLYGGKGKNTLLIPAFTNQSGEIGKLSGFCSNEWKVRVMTRWLRQQNVTSGVRWLGFSVDEMRRVQKDESNWKKRYPLIEKRLNRWECVSLVESMGWPTPPRSSCWMCPNHTQVEWRDIRDNKPEDWKQAVDFDKAIRLRDQNAFVHSDCVPLDEANLDDMNESFFNRCDSGVCFVSC
jgi:hypothetical protein